MNFQLLFCIENYGVDQLVSVHTILNTVFTMLLMLSFE